MEVETSMSGSTFGKQFKITTWGESHGKALGCVVDGCPAGLSLREADIQAYLDRRKPGQSKYTTSRKESDKVEILSGVFEGKTTGTPISLIIHNTNHISKDYDALAHVYRPGHADYTFSAKYGIRDHRGGGRSSGRETIGRVAGGAIASLILKELNIELTTFSKSIGPISAPHESYDFDAISNNPLYMPNLEYAKKAQEYLESLIKNHDSCGGIVESRVTGLPVGLGEPVFNKLDSVLANAVMSIGAVKGVEFGAGFDVTEMLGSENNDIFSPENDELLNSKNEKNVKSQKTRKETNHSGGILGGISDGHNLVLRAAIKPTPSIGKTQNTVTTKNEKTTLTIEGRHDPIIVPRAVVVVESMVAIPLVDLLLQNMGSRIEYLKKVYE